MMLENQSLVCITWKNKSNCEKIYETQMDKTYLKTILLASKVWEKKGKKRKKRKEKKGVLWRMAYLVSRFGFYVSQVFHKLWCSLIMFHLQNYSLPPQTLFELIFLFLKTFWGYLWNYFQVWSQSWLSSICYQIGLLLQIQSTEIIFPIECCN